MTTPLDTAHAEKLHAEQRFFEANARVAAALAEQEELNLRLRQRAEDEVLSRNEYNNVYVFDHDVDDESVRECMQVLTGWSRLLPKGETMEVQLNTSGGDIFAGFTLIDFIRQLRAEGHQITATVYGHAASMGAVILQAADHRVMGANAFMLIHQGSMFTDGDYGHLEDNMKLFEKLHGRILSLLSERATISSAAIKRGWRRQDWWMTADEAKENGFIDEVR